MDSDLREWLLDSDPALRWQVERDLLGAPPSVWEATRARVPLEGLGAALLARQGDDGQWAGGAYFPAGYFDSPEQAEPGQPWIATTWSLKDLRDWGVDAAVLGDTAARLDANSLAPRRAAPGTRWCCAVISDSINPRRAMAGA